MACSCTQVLRLPRRARLWGPLYWFNGLKAFIVIFDKLLAETALSHDAPLVPKATFFAHPLVSVWGNVLSLSPLDGSHEEPV